MAALQFGIFLFVCVLLGRREEVEEVEDVEDVEEEGQEIEGVEGQDETAEDLDGAKDGDRAVEDEIDEDEDEINQPELQGEEAPKSWRFGLVSEDVGCWSPVWNWEQRVGQ